MGIDCEIMKKAGGEKPSAKNPLVFELSVLFAIPVSFSSIH
jgi:hypothetical protein